MPALLIILAIGAYGAICYAAVVYVVAPLLGYLVVAGVGAGVLLVAGVLGVTLSGAARFAAAAVTPALARQRLSPTADAFGRDPAWAGYLFPQVRDDLVAAARRTGRLVGRPWAWMSGAVAEAPLLLAVWPLLLLPLIVGLSFTAAVLASGVVVLAVAGLTVGIGLLLWSTCRAVVRAADSTVRRARGAKATCHVCGWRDRLPAYRCECGAVHHDIRAGKQGVFVRRCECDRALPTMVLRTSGHRLTAVCQECGASLRSGAATLTDINIPVFGAASAGKTRLIYAGMVGLAAHQHAAGRVLTPVGPESRAAVDTATEIIEKDQETTKTDAGRPPVAVTIRFGTARGREALLHLFDAAGEFYADREQSSGLRFLDDTEGLVFVLDPFSIPAVADGLRGPLATRLEDAHPARRHPEDSYQVTALWLRDHDVDLARKPLAVAVVKADLLLALPVSAGLDPDAGSTAVGDWLRRMGLDNLLDGMERDFDAVRYHLVSSMGPGTRPDGGVAPTSPARPLMWLLGRAGAVVDPERAVTT